MEKITITARINAPIASVWNTYTNPESIKAWNNASEEWHTPEAKNDLRTGGKFCYRMEAKDKSAGFDFEGTFEEVRQNESLSYTISDGRRVDVIFSEKDNATEVMVTFEAEDENPVEMQRSGWQAILDNFKKCVER